MKIKPRTEKKTCEISSRERGRDRGNGRTSLQFHIRSWANIRYECLPNWGADPLDLVMNHLVYSVYLLPKPSPSWR